MAVLSAAFGSMANLKYAAYVHEKGWRDSSWQRTQRFDLAIGKGTMALMLMLIQIAAAGALRPNGIEVATVEDIVPIFASVLGDTGRIVMGSTLWAIMFSSYISSGTAYGIIIADVYHRFIRPSDMIERQDSGPGASHMPAYRWLLIYVFVSPLYVFLTDWTPIGLVLFRNVLGIVSVPVVLLVVMRLTADRKIMGD